LLVHRSGSQEEGEHPSALRLWSVEKCHGGNCLPDEEAQNKLSISFHLRAQKAADHQTQLRLRGAAEEVGQFTSRFSEMISS
jgi:hypothetical protein